MEKLIETAHVFLGDGPLAQPHAALSASLESLWAAQEATAPSGSTRLLLGPPARWTSVFLEGGATEPLVRELSARWPVVWLRYRPGLRCYFVLLKGGAELDRVGDAGGSNGDRKPYCPGDPSLWLELLGSQRNAMRLEQAWAMSGEPKALMENTAAILGLSVSACGGDVPSSAIAIGR